MNYSFCHKLAHFAFKPTPSSKKQIRNQFVSLDIMRKTRFKFSKRSTIEMLFSCQTHNNFKTFGHLIQSLQRFRKLIKISSCSDFAVFYHQDYGIITLTNDNEYGIGYSVRIKSNIVKCELQLRAASCSYFASCELCLLCELRVASCTYSKGARTRMFCLIIHLTCFDLCVLFCCLVVCSESKTTKQDTGIKTR